MTEKMRYLNIKIHKSFEDAIDVHKMGSLKKKYTEIL